MCGIYGIVDGHPQAVDAHPQLLRRMAESMKHRGPDDEGSYCGAGVALGMRRLSIIDLEGGHQPIANEDKTVWVVCNGEIYNFQELRAGLVARGHIFQCQSDTEVIVHLYEEEGLELFKRLRGMFAIAIWDVKQSRLVLARDRLGKKPLYIAREPQRFLFASELKSILAVQDASRRLNDTALREYLALGYVPAPLTLIDGIEKLLPGCYLVIEKGKTHSARFWEVPQALSHDRSEAEWIEEIQAKFLESVRIRLISDVPLGAFLSGGIDSSAIVAAMAAASSQPIKTYSIGFEGRDSFYNELPYARIVANAFKTDHHEIVVRPDVATLLPNLIWHLDEPIADSAFITTYLVSKLASESVKVILSGVGGDELFGGYRRYLGESLLRYYRWLPRTARQRWLPSLVASLPQDRHSPIKNYLRYADAFLKSAEAEPAARYMSYVSLFNGELQERLFGNGSDHASHGYVSQTMESYFAAAGECAGANALMYVDLKTSLADDLLALTDKMSMAASIECRAPFMDQQLVELVAGMPDTLKVRGFTTKYLLKKVVSPWLPKEIVHRKKRGFGAPLGSWIRHELGPMLNVLLGEKQVEKRGLFRRSAVQNMIDLHRGEKQDYTDHLLALINLELWCRVFLDGEDRQDLAGLLRDAR